jgi:hypothetical protein
MHPIKFVCIEKVPLAFVRVISIAVYDTALRGRVRARASNWKATA